MAIIRMKLCIFGAPDGYHKDEIYVFKENALCFTNFTKRSRHLSASQPV